MLSHDETFTYWIDRETREGLTRSFHVGVHTSDIRQVRADHAYLGLVSVGQHDGRISYCVAEGRFFLPLPTYHSMTRSKIPALPQTPNDAMADPYASDVIASNYEAALEKAVAHADCLVDLISIGPATCRLEPLVGTPRLASSLDKPVLEMRDIVAGWRDPGRSIAPFFTGLRPDHRGLLFPRAPGDSQPEIYVGKLATNEDEPIPISWHLDHAAIAITDGVAATAQFLRSSPGIYARMEHPGPLIDLIEMDAAIRDIDQPLPDLQAAAACLLDLLDVAALESPVLKQIFDRANAKFPFFQHLRQSVTTALETYTPPTIAGDLLSADEAEAFEVLLK